MIYETTIERDDQEIKLEVEYSAYKGCKGARDSLGGKAGAGPPLEPDEPPSIEIESVINMETGEGVELTRNEENKIENELWDKLGDYDLRD
jgi:hypothetical protein